MIETVRYTGLHPDFTGRMGWLRNNVLGISLVALLVSGGLLFVVLGYVGLVVYSALTTGTPIVGVLLDMAVPYLPVVAALFVVAMISGLGFIWTLVRRASLPRSERLQSLAQRAEREYPPLERIGMSESFAPPKPSPEEQAERALGDLKQRYVNDEISEREFERRVDRLVVNESLDEARAARERQNVLDERS